MNLPEWVESVSGLVAKLTAIPIKISKNMVLVAEYLGSNFTSAIVGLWDKGLAKPLEELSESKLQRIKSTDIAEAAQAHSKDLKIRAEAEKVQAEAELTRAKAGKVDAESRKIDGELLLAHLRQEQEFAQERRKIAEENLRDAVEKLEAQGGALYLDPPSEDEKHEAIDLTKDQPILDRKINSLELSVRAQSVLEDGQILYVWQLVAKRPVDLLRLRSFGRVSLREVERSLAAHGLKLAADESDDD